MLEGWSAEPPERKHLTLLAWCYVGYAVLVAACGVGMAYYPVLLEALFALDRKSGSMPSDVRHVVQITTMVYAVSLWVFAVLCVLTGVMIAKRKGWWFIVVVSGLNTTLVPVGTVLGIFSLVTLTKPHVKAWFLAPKANEAPPRLE